MPLCNTFANPNKTQNRVFEHHCHRHSNIASQGISLQNYTKNKLLDSIKDIYECKLAQQKPASTVHGVIPDLHSTLAKSPSSLQVSTSQTDQISPLLYAERQFNFPQRNNQSSGQSRFLSAPRSNSICPNNRFNVFFKIACRCTNHSQAEREKAFQLNRKIRHFFMEIDVDDMELDEVSNGLQEMITRIQSPDSIDSSDQLHPWNIVSD